MHQRGSDAAARHRRRPLEKRGLSAATFLGSFPAADFPIDPPLPEVAFVGRSNVGKSSLINAVLRRRSLAHTSRTPGKTRHCNVYAVDHTYYLVDLPGYGYARASKTLRHSFSRLLEQYLTTRRALAGVVWLLDIRRDPSPKDRDMAALLAARGLPVLVAVTKADKVSRGRRRDRLSAILSALDTREDQCVITSAKTKEGIEDLRDSVRDLIGTSPAGHRRA